METIQDGHQTKTKIFEVCVKGIACLTNMIAEIDTDAHYVYFVRRILSCVAFCIFYEFSYLLLFEHQQKPLLVS